MAKGVITRALVAVVGAFAFTVAAEAATVINIPAAAFPTADYLASFGVLEESTAGTIHRAPVNFPVAGENICRLTFWAHDNADTDVTVRLMRKRFFLSGSFGPAPETLATVSSSDFSNALRVFTTTSITTRTVSTAFAYWVEIEFLGANPIQVAGVRVQTCP